MLLVKFEAHFLKKRFWYFEMNVLRWKKGGFDMIQKSFMPNIRIASWRKLNARLKNESVRLRVEKDLAQMEAGDFGERVVAKHLDRYRHAENIHIFHDVMLDCDGFFQMDFLVLTESCIILLEVKNISGTIYFTKNPQQLIRKIEGQGEQKLRSPEVQVEKQIYKMREWCMRRGHEIPIYGAVVFPTLTSIVDGSNTTATLLDLYEIENYILKNMQQHSPHLAMDSLILKLKNGQKLYEPYDLSAYYKFEFADLHTGFLCPYCYNFMKKLNTRTWQCPACQQFSRQNVLADLKEYFLYFPKPAHKKILKAWLSDLSSSRFKRSWQKLDLQVQYHHRKAFYSLKNESTHP